MAWVVWGEDPSLAHRQWLELNKLLGSGAAVRRDREPNQSRKTQSKSRAIL